MNITPSSGFDFAPGRAPFRVIRIRERDDVETRAAGVYFVTTPAASPSLHRAAASHPSAARDPLTQSAHRPSWAMRLLNSGPETRELAELVSIHEAGHGVATVVGGAPIGPNGLGLRWEERGEGLTVTGGWADIGEATPLASAAGYAAEKISGRSFGPPMRLWVGTTDYEYVVMGLRVAGSHETPDAVFRQAEAVLRGSWPAVQAVSTELYLTGSLSAERATQIIRSNEC